MRQGGEEGREKECNWVLGGVDRWGCDDGEEEGEQDGVCVGRV